MTITLSHIQLARFLSKTDVPAYDSGCWVWRGSKNNNGYGQFRQKRRLCLAHRVAYEHYYGAIPEGLVVMHKCDNRACVNPDHLVLGTQTENMADCLNKGRVASGDRVKTKRGEAHKRSKLTETDVLAIREDTRSDRKLASEYGVARSLIFRIRKRQVWTHV